MAKRAGSEAARLVLVSTILIEIHKVEQGKYSIRDLKMSKKSAKELQVGYAVLEKFDCFGVTLGVKKKKARGLTPLTCAFDGGRYKIRTCDPIRVKDMLYP